MLGSNPTVPVALSMRERLSPAGAGGWSIMAHSRVSVVLLCGTVYDAAAADERIDLEETEPAA